MNGILYVFPENMLLTRSEIPMLIIRLLTSSGCQHG